MPLTVGTRWLSGRAVLLHLALALVLPLCSVAAWWQVHRALMGNALSWLYVFEWPAFAVISVWLWWVLLSGTPDATGGPAAPPPPVRWDSAMETASLRAYNAFLSDLNAGRPASRPRRSTPREAETR